MSLAEEIIKEFDFSASISDWKEIIESSKSMPEKWDALKKLYSVMTPKILAGERFDPYFVDWTKMFSPIEMDAWCHLRTSDMVFYPQYPLARFFIDFADPIKKIGIELDGKQFHDVNKDKKRDFELLRYGWTIYRIKGFEAVRDGDYYEKWEDMVEAQKYDSEIEKEIDYWLFGTGEGVIRAIEFCEYGGCDLPYKAHMEEWYEGGSLRKAEECLRQHCYTR